LDPESAAWVRALTTGPDDADRDAVVRLHELVLRIARAETYRRRDQLHVSGPELDDLAHQAAADAVMAILAKLPTFRGESRFTTWAYRFVILEVSAVFARHFWRHPTVRFDSEDWDRLPDRFGLETGLESESADLIVALRAAVESELSARQRAVFVALVLNGVPVDALAIELGSTRNSIYKMMFDARRKLRAALVANGYLDPDPSRTS
jgi:RNA polymerase sigma-70 factor (ECF subfamily)